MAELPDDQRILLELLDARRELAKLRLIVTEKFAGADLYVKPEDAADVAKWASNAQHVRELISHEPRVRYVDGDENSECPQCGTQTAAHGRETFPSGGPTRRYCRVAAAWRALGDPRGAEDIERAHEEALGEKLTRSWRSLALTESQRARLVETVGGAGSHMTMDQIADAAEAIQREARDEPFRLASESQAAAQARHFEPIPLEHWGTERGRLLLERRDSDARGMEAVEAEARVRRWQPARQIALT